MLFWRSVDNPKVYFDAVNQPLKKKKLTGKKKENEIEGSIILYCVCTVDDVMSEFLSY